MNKRRHTKEAKVLVIVLIVSLALVTIAIGSYAVISRYSIKTISRIDTLRNDVTDISESVTETVSESVTESSGGN